MDIMEIILLVAGGIIFVLSFFIPDKKTAGNALSEDDIKALAEQELEVVRERVDEAVEESVSYAMEKTERSLERLSNEKIMAVNEYSDTVLSEIHKNHEEVMFLYDMLNNKHTSLKNTVAEVNRAIKEAEAAVTGLRGQAVQIPVEAAQKSDCPPVERTAEPEIEAVAAERPGLEPDESQEAEPEKNNKERIVALYRQGKSASVIARELGLGVGEVKLVIDLFVTVESSQSEASAVSDQ